MSPVFNAEVVVMPQEEVADPQGQAIEEALHRLQIEGMDGIEMEHIRVGKVFHLRVRAADRASAEKALRNLADRVLANPNTEEFECHVEGEA